MSPLGGSSSSGVCGKCVRPITSTHPRQALVRRALDTISLLWIHSLTLFIIVLEVISFTAHENHRFRDFVLISRIRLLIVRSNSRKETVKSLSRQPRKQRHKRHARYAFHVRLKNSREECEAENSKERRAATRATLALRATSCAARRPPPALHAPLFTSILLWNSHITYECFTRGRSRVYKQPRTFCVLWAESSLPNENIPK